MAATAMVVQAWRDQTNAYVTVEVQEGGDLGAQRYSAFTPLSDAAGTVKDAAWLRADLRAAVQNARQQRLASFVAIDVGSTLAL